MAKEIDHRAEKLKGSIGIRINAKDVQQVGDGKFMVYIPAVELSETALTMLDELFPNTRLDVERALVKEGMLNAIDRSTVRH